MSESRKITCWVVSEGMAGTENQCLGVAEAMGLDPVVKRIKLKAPWKQVGQWVPWGIARAFAPDSAPIVPPWPDLVIASGRKSVGVSRYIKRMSGGKTFTVQLQDPRVDPKHFDLVAVGQHDPTRGPNVLVTVGGAHKVTKAKIAAARKEWEDKFSYLPTPRVAVLIGGTSKVHDMTEANCTQLAEQLLAIRGHCGMMINTSRRTGEKNAAFLREKLEDEKRVFFWSSYSESHYYGFLSMADYVIVTSDSASMACEALVTEKPVYIASLEGGARRLDLFQRQLREQGYTRPFTGALEAPWDYKDPATTQRIADEIRKRMKL